MTIRSAFGAVSSTPRPSQHAALPQERACSPWQAGVEPAFAEGITE